MISSTEGENMLITDEEYVPTVIEPNHDIVKLWYLHVCR
jgi:hypothetical protein